MLPRSHLKILLCAILVLSGPGLASEPAREGGVELFMGAADFEVHKLFEGERNPNIVVALDGTVVASWGEVENNFALGKKGIRVRRSADGGRTWGPLITVAKPCWHGGGLTVDERSGDIMAFAEAKYPPAEKWIFRSRDHGRSWQRVKKAVIKPDKHGNVPDMHFAEHGITLRHGRHAGRLLRAARWYGGGDNRANLPRMYNTAIYSDDGGTTWNTSAPFPELGTGEGAVAELSDGRIYYNSRRHADPEGSKYNPALRWEAWSEDGGLTWKNAAMCRILPDGARKSIGPGSGCFAGLVRLPIKGRDVLLYSNCDSATEERRDVTVWVSFDGAGTWPIKRRVWDGPSAYSSLNAGRPGTSSAGWIYLLLEAGKSHRYEDGYLARFNLSWLLEGEETGDGTLPEWLER